LLGRIDLTQEHHVKTWDCLDEIEGVDIDFDVPYFDLVDFDYSALATNTANTAVTHLRDNEMIVGLRHKALQLQFVTQLDSTHSWYWPKKVRCPKP